MAATAVAAGPFSYAVYDHATQSIATGRTPSPTTQAAYWAAAQMTYDLQRWYGPHAAYRVRIYDEGTGDVVWEKEY